MDETIILPSPNWFQVSGLAVSNDGWLVYGGPSKSLCVLEPLPKEYNNIVKGSQKYHAHVINRAHSEKIVSVDISPEWPEKRLVLTGSADGFVKQWNLELLPEGHKIKPTHSHEIHSQEKEDIAGVGYSIEVFAVTVGGFGNIVKWDLNSNVVKTYNFLKNFKPACMSCSPHIPLNVAVGTKQGVVFVLDLNGAGKVVYKIRGQDDEIVNLSWCPKYEVALKKALKVSEKRAIISSRKPRKKAVSTEEALDASACEKIQFHTEEALDTSACEKIQVYTEEALDASACEKIQDHTEETLDASSSVKNQVRTEEALDASACEKIQVHAEEALDESACAKIQVHTEETLDASSSVKNQVHTEKALDASACKKIQVHTEEALDESACAKSLPEDSFDDSVVIPEDDMFDIYTDHAADEFGHKKYQPEDLLVKVQQKADKQDDYLGECLKLKEDILKKKTQSDSSIQSLVDALDKIHVESVDQVLAGNSTESSLKCDTKDNKFNKQDMIVASAHIHKHLLATISKYGGVRIWSKSGKQVGSCVVSANNKNQKNNMPFWPTLLWYKSGVLLLSDGKNQLLQCNPLNIDCKNKLEWSAVHTLHKRSIYCIASNAPRLQVVDNPSDDWQIWTASQDRNIVQYSMSKRQKVAIHSTCGGFLYTVAVCPYDANKVATSAGDGAVRILETSTLEDDETKLHDEHVTSYWQNVQGKVLVVAWHPTRENLLAFATAESRVGLIDISGMVERPARALVPALNGGVYSIAWGEGRQLYACATSDLVVYHTNKPDDAPVLIPVSVEGQRLVVTCVQWSARALACGSVAGAVALLTAKPPHELLAATFVCSKMVHMIEWHPQQTSSSNEESPYKNLIAVCSVDKQSNIIILEYIEKEDNTKQLQTWKILSGHRLPALQVMWNPHLEGRLLSTSQDCTVRVWDALEGTCLSIFGGHAAPTLGAAWSARPALPAAVLSGGGDCCLRLWRAGDHPADSYDPSKHDVMPPKKEKKKQKKEQKNKEKKETDNTEERTAIEVSNEQVAASTENYVKGSKKFLLPTLFKQMARDGENILTGVKYMVHKYLEKASPDKLSDFSVSTEESYDLDFVKIFGTINDVNEVLDMEMERHQERHNSEAWIMLSIFRGHIDAMIQFASQRDRLCPFLISIAPCVSLKYWKDATQLYLAQIDRLVAKGQDERLYASKIYGGTVYRKVATLLSVHDVKAAVATLVEAHLYKEAYILCRTRYMDSIAEETLEKWALYCVRAGAFVMTAVCYIALGNLSQAAAFLGKLNDQKSLQLAADIAKMVGQNTFADHISEKRENIKSTDIANEILKELPSRFEALMKDGDKKHNGDETFANGKPALENGSGDAKE